MSMRVCSVAGCGTIYEQERGSRCLQHQREARRQRRPQQSHYKTAGHQRFRNGVLTRDTICVTCNQQFATVADHYPLSRIELVERGMNPNDPQHGRGLCVTCHNRWTAQSTQGGIHNR